MPALTRRHTGLAHDASAAVARPPASEATGAGVVGTYAVTPGDPAAAGGYTAGTFHQGALTVNPAGLTAAAGDQAVTGGGGVPAPTCKHAGPVNRPGGHRQLHHRHLQRRHAGRPPGDACAGEAQALAR